MTRVRPEPVNLPRLPRRTPLIGFSPVCLERRMGDHARLAAAAADQPAIAAMHRELAILCHEQIIRMVLDERFDLGEPAASPRSVALAERT